MTDRDKLDWRISRRSSGGNCVAVAVYDGRVYMRNSKDPNGPMLTFELTVFQDFVEFVKETDTAGR